MVEFFKFFNFLKYDDFVLYEIFIVSCSFAADFCETVIVRNANFSGNVKTVGNIQEISEKKIGNIPKFSDL